MWKKAGSNVVVMVAVLGWSTSKLIFSFVHHWLSFLLRFLYFRISFPKLPIFFCEPPTMPAPKKKKKMVEILQANGHPSPSHPVLATPHCNGTGENQTETVPRKSDGDR